MNTSINEDEITFLQVPVGYVGNTYSIGDLLNAVDSVVCHFLEMREQTDVEISEALHLYACQMNRRGDGLL